MVWLTDFRRTAVLADDCLADCFYLQALSAIEMMHKREAAVISHSRRNCTHIEHVVLTLLCVPLIVAYGIALFAPGVALWGDDGTYVVTAKAMAENHGYR